MPGGGGYRGVQPGPDGERSRGLPGAEGPPGAWGMYGQGRQPNVADQISADLAREQYEDYQKRFEPIEREYVREISDPNFVSRGVENTRAQINQAEKVSQGMTERNISRAGLNVTPAQREALERLRKMGQAKNMTQGLHLARDAYSDIQMEGLNTVVGYGRGIEKNVSEISGNLARQGAQRDAANRIAEEQSDQARNNTVLSLGMMFLAFSSQTYKQNIKPADIEALHQIMMNVEVNTFDYRADAPAEVAGKPNNIGPIAEQLPALFVTEDGKQIDLYNFIFSILASHQHLAKRVAQLESSQGA